MASMKKLLPICALLLIPAMILALVFEKEASNREAAPQPLPLSQIKYWAYQIQKIDEVGAVEKLASSDYDLLVLEPTRTDKDADIASFDTRSMVEKLKNTRAHDGVHRKLVLAYVDIGEAESWRWYWTWSEEWQKGQPRPADWPDYILTHDPDGWADNYPVAFWDPHWKDIVIYGKSSQSRGPDYKSMLDEIIKDDFDGIYLDWVEAFENEEVAQEAKRQGKDPPEEMITFIREMKTYAKARNSHFLIVQQNAPALALDGRDKNLFQVIDAIAQEDIWYDGIADTPWHNPKGYDLLVEEEITQTLLEELTVFQKAEIPIFNVEYALHFADDAYQKSIERGFIPYVTRKSLEQLTSTSPPLLRQSQTLQSFEKRPE